MIGDFAEASGTNGITSGGVSIQVYKLLNTISVENGIFHGFKVIVFCKFQFLKIFTPLLIIEWE
jgi:hypothetical protein